MSRGPLPNPGREALLAAGLHDPSRPLPEVYTALGVSEATLRRWARALGMSTLTKERRDAQAARAASIGVHASGRHVVHLRRWAAGQGAKLKRMDTWRLYAESRGHLTAEGTVTLAGWGVLLERRERDWLMGEMVEAPAYGGAPEREMPRKECLALARLGLCKRAGQGKWALAPLGEMLVGHWRRQAARSALGWDV